MFNRRLGCCGEGESSDGTEKITTQSICIMEI